jgi:mannobiose 2-epimerase
MIAFSWLDRNAYDPKLNGWFETLDAKNKPILVSDPGSADSIGTPYGIRSMNTTIHILEALVELYVLTKDPQVKTRLQRAFVIVRDSYTTPKGELHYYLSADYANSRSEMDSYGHELETAYLLLETAEVLGKPDDKVTWRKAKSLVDHCLDVAWDDTSGGFFYEGHIGKGPTDRKKVWWTTAEGLNALRIFAQKYGGRYLTRYEQLWKFVLEHQIDNVSGGWHPTLDESNHPIAGNKSDAWTEGYHQARAVFLASGQEMYSHHK